MKRTETVCLFVACMLAITIRPAFAQTTTINDNDSHIVYSLGIAPDCFGSTSVGNWCYFSGGGSQDDNSDETSSNFVRSSGSNFQGASLALTFNGTEIKLYGSKGPNHGKLFYSLDGGAQSGTMNLYANSLSQHQTLLDLPSLASGYHVLYVGALHDRDDASNNYWLTIDSFDITGSAVSLSDGTVAGWNSSDITFWPSVVHYPPGGDHWSCGEDKSNDLSGAHCWSKTANDYMSWTCTSCSLIEVYGRPDAENGYMDVSIDGGTATRVDLNLGNVDDDAINATLLYAKRFSSSGMHTITITVVGSNDGHACSAVDFLIRFLGKKGTCGNYVQIDELVAF
jgi:hypothetical protein